MDKDKTIIVMGAGKVLAAELIEIQHSHGIDVIVISDHQAKEQGLISSGALQIEHKPFILTNLRKFELPEMFYDKHQAKNNCKKGWRKK